MPTIDKAFAEFETLIATAAAGIEYPYFQLPVFQEPDFVYRERVYCYELYHQLRSIWKGFNFSLSGEVDKAGHPIFRPGPYARAKPDFLVHHPGDMERNLACVEVKPFSRPTREFQDDLRKLTWFCRNANYHRGLFLVYGTEHGDLKNDDLLRDKLEQAVRHPSVDIRCIRFMHHSAVGAHAERIEL